MPIKPQYAEKLLTGEKRFEYRRRVFASKVSHIIIYASSPLKRILGVVKIQDIHSGKPSQTWRETASGAGITKREFSEYFAGTETAYAIEVDPKSVYRFPVHVAPADIEANFHVPQSFRYVSDLFFQKLMGLL